VKLLISKVYWKINIMYHSNRKGNEQLELKTCLVLSGAEEMSSS
jgi:hypothetical protein